MNFKTLIQNYLPIPFNKSNAKCFAPLIIGINSIFNLLKDKLSYREANFQL